MSDSVKYTLDQLMRVEAETEWHGQTFYLRTLGARQDELRQAQALAHARSYRKKLRDARSEEYALYVAPLVDADRDELLAIIEGAEERRVTAAADEVVDPDGEGSVPDDGELSDVLDAEDRQEEIDRDVAERRRAWISEQMAAWRESAKELSDDEVRARATDEHINNMAARAYSERFNDVTLLHGVFTDKKRTRSFFKSQDDVDNVPSELKLHLLREYLKLDEASRDPGVLKN